MPIISVGNLTIGGSGKTPVTIELAKKFNDACVILRGYKRESKGLIIVSYKGDIKVDVKTSGDEAMLLAKSLKNATIIVSEDRIKAIYEAKKLGAKIIFLDDAFSKYKIKKFDILVKPKDEPTNNFCLPSGAYREPKSFYNKANLILKEGIDFKRVVSIQKDGKSVESIGKIAVLTAISKPKRLLEFLPKDTKLLAFADHHNFTKEQVENILKEYKDYSILTTGKDFVKLKDFNINNLYLMNLEISFKDETILKSLYKYVKNY